LLSLGNYSQHWISYVCKNAKLGGHAFAADVLFALKEHKHEIFFFTFFAETETLWTQGPVTRDF
jgi:hypothetical protein